MRRTLRIVHTSLAAMLALGMMATPSALAAGNSVTSSATGSGHMVRPDGTFRSFSFAAHESEDGTVTGQMQLNSRGFDVFVHIAIDCLRVDGNVAYMSGRITYSSNPAEGVVGELNRWSVQDNGEPGIGAVPDLVSSVPTNPTNDPTQTCDLQNSPPGPTRDVQRGNVQVHS